MHKQAVDTKLLSSSRGLGTRVRFTTCSSKVTLLEYFYVVHCLVGYANMVTNACTVWSAYTGTFLLTPSSQCLKIPRSLMSEFDTAPCTLASFSLKNQRKGLHIRLHLNLGGLPPHWVIEFTAYLLQKVFGVTLQLS